MLDQFLFSPADLPSSPYGAPTETPDAQDGHTRPRVLVVDDERLIASTVAAILNANGFEAVAAYSGEEALAAAAELHPDIVLSDVLMPRMTGVDLCIRLTKEFPRARILLFSGQAATSELMRKAKADGHSFELFAKPIHPEELISKLRAV